MLLRVIPSVLLATSLKLRSIRGSHKFIAIKFLLFEYMIFLKIGSNYSGDFVGFVCTGLPQKPLETSLISYRLIHIIFKKSLFSGKFGVLFSYTTRFEILPFALLPTKYQIH